MKNLSPSSLSGAAAFHYDNPGGHRYVTASEDPDPRAAKEAMNATLAKLKAEKPTTVRKGTPLENVVNAKDMTSPTPAKKKAAPGAGLPALSNPLSQRHLLEA